MSTAKKKVLLMGKSGSGKTSMRSVIFSNFSARDTQRLGATIDVEQSAVRFLGSLVLNLWDCGGQASFLDNYLTAQKDTIFSNVAVLIYVFDITSKEWEKDLGYFADVLESLRRNSDDAGVWVLINKMDLRDKEDPKRQLYHERKADIEEVNRKLGEGEGEENLDQAGFLRCFPTSIWDESLYKAWSSVIHTLIPNINLITSHLTFLRDLCLSTEAVLFESETFLVIAKSGSPIDSDPSDYDQQEIERGGRNCDPQRFEKLSEIIKGFRKTCQRSGEQFMGWECKFDDCTVILEPSTKNTFIMMISPDPRIETAMLQYILHQSQVHLMEIGTLQTIERKCSLCKVSKDVKYVAKGDEDPNIIAWDDAGQDFDNTL